jgi:hypothetical protein
MHWELVPFPTADDEIKGLEQAESLKYEREKSLADT